MVFKIKLSDFPDIVYINLKSSFKKEFFKELLNKFQNYSKLGRMVGVNYRTIQHWERGIQKNYIEYIPMWAIKKLLKFSSFSIKDIERNVIAYRSHGGGIRKLEVKTPILPIKDSPELRELITHMLCDGHYGTNVNYTNVSSKARKDFISKLKIFGNVEFVEEENLERSRNHIHLPKIILDIIIKYFNNRFGTSCGFLPKQFFHGNRKFLAAIIRAIIVDEGTVRDSYVEISIINKKLISQVQHICKKLRYKTSKIKEYKKGVFTFSILSESLETLLKDCRPLPIKQDLIEFALSRKGNRKRPIGQTKKEIIKLLSRNPMTAKELALKLNIKPANVRNKHLKKLYENGIVKPIGVEKIKRGPLIWAIEK